MLEADGGEALVRWFDGLQEEFSIEVEMVVHTTKENPFGWIITYPPVLQLPATYPPSEANSVLSCLQGSMPIANAVQQWAAELAAAVDGSSIDFLMHVWAEALALPQRCKPRGAPGPRSRSTPAAFSAGALTITGHYCQPLLSRNDNHV